MKNFIKFKFAHDSSNKLYPQLGQYQQQQQQSNYFCDSGLGDQNNENLHFMQQQQMQHPSSDLTMNANNNRISIYFQANPHTKTSGQLFQPSMSVLNSPQQMSTPINMRVKDNMFANQQQQQQQQPQQRSQFQHQQQQQQQQPFGMSRQQNVQMPYVKQQQTFIPTQQVQAQQAHQQQAIQPVQQGFQATGAQNECELVFSGRHDAMYIYLARLLAPIWDQSLLVELNVNGAPISNDNGLDNSLFATFNEISVQWYLNKVMWYLN
jgi:hypothetical protein